MISATEAALRAEANRMIKDFDTKVTQFEGVLRSLNGWVPMAILPVCTGKYLIGHRGHQEVHHFLADDKEWHPTAKLGWQGSLNFGPTHWFKFPEIESPPSAGPTDQVF